MAVSFRPGQVVLRRCLHPDGRLATVQCARVVADDERGLAIWIGAGATTMRRVDLHGETTRHLRDLPTLAPARAGMAGVGLEQISRPG